MSATGIIEFIQCMPIHARIQKDLSEGNNLFFRFFSLMKGGRIKIPLLAGHGRPASETPFKYVPMMDQN